MSLCDRLEEHWLGDTKYVVCTCSSITDWFLFEGETHQKWSRPWLHIFTSNCFVTKPFQ